MTNIDLITNDFSWTTQYHPGRRHMHTKHYIITHIMNGNGKKKIYENTYLHVDTVALHSFWIYMSL